MRLMAAPIAAGGEPSLGDLRLTKQKFSKPEVSQHDESRANRHSCHLHGLYRFW
ncbi:hypothetical protein L21SP2_0866 [Salinispira pacifica]|uniref:Uncharacterized protein n=1 Tax=Salinispira pacifica TaxID=1307761 RepID=V5WGJ4_9SPIO|nr:hypothetical protein L21SP2_0866 [Salinispira pacifica]